jgi:dTDP-4-dehydrorhamnose reductase
LTKPPILLTGAGGQVGREIQRTAREAGAALLACDHAALDVTDDDAVERILRQARPALIVNAAAYTAVDRAEDEPQRAFRINRDGAASLARAAAAAGVPLIHLSTDYVFDGTSPRAYTENDPASPLGVYGQSKWEGEEAVRRLLPRHLIVRVSWVFGFYGHNFVKTILRLAAARDTLQVVADQTGGPTYAGHIAALVLHLAARIAAAEEIAWGTYHFCGRPITSWHGLAEVAVAAGRRLGLIDHPVAVMAIGTEDYPTRARRPANSALDCRKLEAAFGPAPHLWQTGLDDMLQRIAAEAA